MYSSSKNKIFNNCFNNTNDFFLDGLIPTNSWNTTKIVCANIIGGSYLGGNFWANPNSTGFSQPFTLQANVTYNYTIRTGSYPQIIHNSTFGNRMGTITGSEFIDANGRRYPDWILAIRLEQ